MLALLAMRVAAGGGPAGLEGAGEVCNNSLTVFC